MTTPPLHTLPALMLAAPLLFSPGPLMGEISQTPVTTATNRQVSPGVAWSGERALVVWFDERDGWDVHGAFLDGQAGALTPSDVLISGARNSQSNPVVTWTGEHFITLWDDGRSGQYTQLYLSRVGEDGTVLDPEGIFFSSGPHHQNHPHLSWGEGQGLVVFQDYRDGSWDIYGARVDGAGQNQDPEGIPIATAGDSLWYPAAAWDGENWLVVWQDTRGDYYDILGVRVSAEGEVLDATPIAISTDMPRYQYAPRVAFGGGVFLVAWSDGVNIWSRRVGPDGSLLDAAEVPICEAYGYQDDVDVAYGDGRFTLAWSDGRAETAPDLSVAQVSPGGGVLDPDGVVISTIPGYQYEPVITATDGQMLIAWTDNRDGTYAHDIYAAAIPSYDLDGDGFPREQDLCPQVSNPGQEDIDGDAIGDLCDVCPDVYDPDQLDSDGDGKGDACELGGCESAPGAGGGSALGLMLMGLLALARRRPSDWT